MLVSYYIILYRNFNWAIMINFPVFLRKENGSHPTALQICKIKGFVKEVQVLNSTQKQPTSITWCGMPFHFTLYTASLGHLLVQPASCWMFVFRRHPNLLISFNQSSTSTSLASVQSLMTDNKHHQSWKMWITQLKKTDLSSAHLFFCNSLIDTSQPVPMLV